MKKRTASVFLALCLALSAFLGGCGVDQSEEELEKIEYTVVKPNEIPEGLMEQIKEKEQAGFELSFQDQKAMGSRRRVDIVFRWKNVTWHRTRFV